MDEERKEQGSRPIGNLIKQALNSLRVVDSTPGPSLSNSPTTGTPDQAPQRSKPTGPQPGEPGAVVRVPTKDEARALVAQVLAGEGMLCDPAQLLPHCVQSSLEAVWTDGGNDDGYGWDGYVIRYEPVAEIGPGNREHALALAEAMLEPGSPAQIARELSRLRVLTASRDVGEDLQLVFAAYTDELRRYPLDVVRDVLRDIGRSQKFWPTASELVERLDRLVRPRHALRRALRQPYVPPVNSPDWIPNPLPEPEQLAKVMELLAKNGIELDEHGRVRPLGQAIPTSNMMRRVHAETRGFKLLPEDDPRVQAQLRQMGEEG